jgi:hypothetical protein
VSFQNCQRWRQVASKEKSTIFSFFFYPVSPSMTTNQIKPIQSRQMCFYVEEKKLNIELNKTRFNFLGGFLQKRQFIGL